MHGTLEFGAAVLEQHLVTQPRSILQDSTHEALCESDESLIRASQQGDTEAFGQLYRRYARMVHGVLLNRVHATDVEDLVQDVFLRALPRLRGLRDVTRFGPWLAAIARNLAVDFHRRTHLRTGSRDGSADPTEQPAAGKAPDAHEAEEILECIRSLPEAYREPLILRLVEGMSGPEIAGRTGLQPGSVRVNLHRGMQQLRERLALRGPSRTSTPAGLKGRPQV
jgi:RNA polymerase sigma-70 factor, ECF subfamily